MNSETCLREKREYHNAEGQTVSLLRLIKNEPEWAENQILHRDQLESQLATALVEIEQLRAVILEISRLSDAALKLAESHVERRR